MLCLFCRATTTSLWRRNAATRQGNLINLHSLLSLYSPIPSLPVMNVSICAVKHAVCAVADSPHVTPARQTTMNRLNAVSALATSTLLALLAIIAYVSYPTGHAPTGKLIVNSLEV